MLAQPLFTDERHVVRDGLADETPFRGGHLYTLTEFGQRHLGVRTVRQALALNVGDARPLDKCREPDCTREGVPGNENIVRGRPVCDYCHAKMLAKAKAKSQ